MAQTQKTWYAAEIEVDAAAAEAVEFALNELDALGTQIDQLGRKDAAAITVVGYFEEMPEEEHLRAAVGEALRIYALPADFLKRVERREVENRDWLAEWKKHWQPTETGRFIVAPVWQTVATENKIVVRIEPSMAFGTGTHETTRLCLRAIERLYRPGESFFDVGTGTGILAIAAAKLSARENPNAPTASFAGCDTDADSIAIARENAVINEVEPIDFYVGSISPATTARDFVCANLTADVILPLLPLLVEKSKRVLVLSGILTEQETLVTDELKKLGATDFKVETEGEWISVTAERSGH